MKKINTAYSVLPQTSAEPLIVSGGGGTRPADQVARVAIRAGHHCAMPVMERFHVPATCRTSFAFYNTQEEVDALVKAIHKGKRLFHP